jgi:hypothetical protein
MEEELTAQQKVQDAATTQEVEAELSVAAVDEGVDEVTEVVDTET